MTPNFFCKPPDNTLIVHSRRKSPLYVAKWVRHKAEDEKQKYNPPAANGVTQGLACQGKKEK